MRWNSLLRGKHGVQLSLGDRNHVLVTSIETLDRHGLNDGLLNRIVGYLRFRCLNFFNWSGPDETLLVGLHRCVSWLSHRRDLRNISDLIGHLKSLKSLMSVLDLAEIAVEESEVDESPETHTESENTSKTTLSMVTSRSSLSAVGSHLGSSLSTSMRLLTVLGTVFRSSMLRLAMVLGLTVLRFVMMLRLVMLRFTMMAGSLTRF